MKVNFVIGGFQKCGTTALFDFLTHHPKIIGSKPKELDFFNYDFNYEKGENFYHSNFKQRPFLSSLRGYRYLDGSPSYAADSDIALTAKRIHHYNPKMKVIILVRNPIDRAFSAWNMYKKLYEKGDKDWWVKWVEERTNKKSKAIRRSDEDYNDFAVFIKNELNAIKENREIECNILNNGFYTNGIKLFKEKFSDNLLVVKNESLDNNTIVEMNKISSFLNLPYFDWKVIESKKIFKGQYKNEIDPNTSKDLSQYYKSSNEELFKLTNILYE